MAVPAAVRADAAHDGNPPRPPRSSPLGPKPSNGYWSMGKPRWFVSTQSELGTVYAKPYVSAGYGMPHWIWAGLDLNAITTLGMQQVYSGLRVATPVFNLGLGVRDTWSFGRPFLAPRERFRERDVSDAAGSAARYLAFESEAMAVVPLPYSALAFNFIVVDMLDKPDGAYVFDESYRTVVRNSAFFVFRFTALARLLRNDCLKAGVLTEFITNTGREHGVVRVGPVAMLQLTDHLSVQAGLTVPVWSPDDLGLLLGAYGLAGFRYQWASDESDPKAPWEGDLIP
ncbi:MAG: hypothetical protein R3A78_04445 [Polyangiales bacterium]